MPAKRDELMERLLEGEQIRQRGGLLPIASTTWGNVVPAVPGFAMDAWQGAVDHMTGKHGMVTDSTFDQQGAIEGAFNAGTAVGGAGALAAKPAGAIGMGAMRQAKPTHYHGTGAQITKFDPERIGRTSDSGYLGEGFYFADDPDIAAFYANRSAGGSPNVMPVKIDQTDFYQYGKKNRGVQGEIEGTPSLPDDIRQAVFDRARWQPGDDVDEFTSTDLSRALTEVLQDRGYRGVRATFSDGGEELMVLPGSRGTVRSAITDETLFSDPLAALLLQQQEDNE